MKRMKRVLMLLVCTVMIQPAAAKNIATTVVYAEESTNGESSQSDSGSTGEKTDAVVSADPAPSGTAAVQTEPKVKTAEIKNGLKVEGQNTYFYVNGKKVKNTWKTVKINSKIGKKKLYFGTTGAAVKAKKRWPEDTAKKLVVTKKIGTKTYGFDMNGYLVGQGIRLDADERPSVFTKYGTVNAKKTKALRTAIKNNKIDKVLKLLGTPNRKRKSGSCDVDQDIYPKALNYYFDNFNFWIKWNPKTGKKMIPKFPFVVK